MLIVSLVVYVGLFSEVVGREGFVMEPKNTLVRSNSTVTFLWAFEDSSGNIRRGEIFTNFGGREEIIFRTVVGGLVTTFGSNEYLKRVDMSHLGTPMATNISVQMVIRNVSTADTGVYSFKVTRFFALAPAVSNVRLTVIVPPETPNITCPGAKVMSSKAIVKEGDNLQCVCNSAGVPLPNVWWEESGKKYPTSILAKNNTQRSENGTYTCVADNGFGRKKSNFDVDVHYLELKCSSEFNLTQKALVVHVQVAANPPPLCQNTMGCSFTATLSATNPIVFQNVSNDAGVGTCKLDSFFERIKCSSSSITLPVKAISDKSTNSYHYEFSGGELFLNNLRVQGDKLVDKNGTVVFDQDNPSDAKLKQKFGQACSGSTQVPCSVLLISEIILSLSILAKYIN